MKVAGLEVLRCDAGWRNYHFLKLTTDEGIVGWSEFDEGFGSPGVGAAIRHLSARVVGQNVFQHERIHAELFAATRPAAGGVVAQALGAIENALLEHPGVAEAAVTGEPDDDLGERIVAWVVPAGDERPSEQELADHVARLLTPHKRPREVRYLDELPRNAMGKITKAKLCP